MSPFWARPVRSESFRDPLFAVGLGASENQMPTLPTTKINAKRKEVCGGV
jgi:hypothetical protein